MFKHPGHMTNVAIMPIYDKNLYQSSSQDEFKLGIRLCYSNDDLGLTLTFLQQGQIWENVKTEDFERKL